MKKYIIIAILVIILAGTGISYGVYHTPKKLVVENIQTATTQTAPWLSDYAAIPGGKEANLGEMVATVEYSVDLGKNTTLQFSFKPETIKYEDRVRFTYKKKDGSSENIPFSNAKTGTFIFADLNFDGYRDIIGPSTNGGVIGGSEQSEVYMHDPATGAFIKDSALVFYSAQTDVFNVEKKTFVHVTSYADSWGEETYAFTNNKWVLIKDRTIDSMVDDPKYDCLYTEEELVGGELSETVHQNFKLKGDGETCTTHTPITAK